MRKCSIKGCDRKHDSLGFCKMHITRLRRHRDINKGIIGKTFKERFQEHIKIEADCWIWTGSCSPKGYGYYRFNGKPTSVHRISWMLFCGEISPKMQILHHCDNPSCVNPKHLYMGTHKNNMDDRAKRGRTNHPIGEKNNQSKLTEKQVKEIRKDSRTLKEIAKDYGVSFGTIGHIKQGRTWSHL